MSMTILSSYDGRAENKDGTFRDIRKEDTYLTKKVINGVRKSYVPHLKRYELGGYYDPHSLEELLPLVEEWRKDPYSMISRCKYLPRFRKGSLVPRGEDVSVQTVFRTVCIDIDDLIIPNNILAIDIKAQAEYAMSLLHKCSPEVFPDDLGYIAHGSSSAGIQNEKIKLHIWICNEEKLHHEQYKTLFKSINAKYKSLFDTTDNLVDIALYSARQPHYVADPVFVGCSDPFTEEMPRLVHFYGSMAKASPSIAYNDSKVIVTDKEKNQYLDRIEGSCVPSARLQRLIEELYAWNPDKGGARTHVQKIYHNAVQECFDLSILDIEIEKILKVIRPSKEMDYINQGRKVAITNILKNSDRALPNEVLGIKVEEQKTPTEDFYVSLPEMPKDNTVVFLKASLGTGKTFNISRLLKGYEGSFLSVTNTVALVESNAARFESGCYNQDKDLQDFKMGDINRMCSTIHSLSKFAEYTFDFIFIDECDAVMQDLLNSSIIQEYKRGLIRNALEDLLARAKVVVLSDGDISKETMEAYTSLMGGQKDIVKVSHIRENLRDGVAYKHKSIESLLGAMEGSLDNGRKCLLVSDLSPLKLNSFFVTFQRLMPDQNGIVMHSSSKLDDEFMDIVNNTTEALEKRDVNYLLCSPSITNGVDFNYFDTIFVITTTTNQSPNLRFQALKRERRANDIHFYQPRLNGYTSGYALLPDCQDWLEKYRRKFALRKERECSHYLNTFNHYLIKSGCKVVVVDDSFTNPQDTLDKEVALLERSTAIYTGISSKHHNDAPEMLRMIGFFIEDIDIASISSFIKNRIYEKAEALSKVIEEFWFVLKFADVEKLQAVLQSESGFRFNFLSGHSLPRDLLGATRNTSICLDILKSYGLDKKENLPNVIENYKNYCVYKEIAILPELKQQAEDNYELR